MSPMCRRVETEFRNWREFLGAQAKVSEKYSGRIKAWGFKAPSTLIRFQTKTKLFCSGYGYRPHYNAKNDHRKLSHSKTLSRLERLENDTFWKRCFLVWTEKTMLSENGDVIKVDTTERQTTRAWVSKMTDRRYHVTSLLIGMISSPLMLLQAHLTMLRHHLDFTRREQDILRLLALPASGK